VDLLIDVRPLRTPEVQAVVGTTPSGCLSPGVGDSQPSRVAHIRQSLIEEGFSEEVAERAASHLRNSSLSLYQSHFGAFRGWVSERGLSVEQLSVPVVADYLLFLFHQRKLQSSTIACHRSAISETLPRMGGYTIGSHPVLSNLIRNFSVIRSPVRNRVPDCRGFCLGSLAQISSPLSGAPSGETEDNFEDCVSPLASSKRASELHALSRHQSDFVFAKWQRAKWE
jgi:hypothetical protein